MNTKTITACPPATPPLYRGRFAPSPTGQLHLGSLIAALGSYLMARSQQGEWWLRIEDIDPPREVPGAADAIRHSLEKFGFEWDQLCYQHDRLAAYQEALTRLKNTGMVYPCTCSRKAIAENSPEPGRYPGTCRGQRHTDHAHPAWRVNTHGVNIIVDDQLQGRLSYDLETEVGDYVVFRADGYVAYQLASAVDDAQQGMTEVVRGVDLLDSTPRQIYLQHLLKLPTPRYTHLPILVNKLGQKLSKQTYAKPLADHDPVPQLWLAMSVLGQAPPPALRHADLANLWAWARTHWDSTKITSQQEICLDILD